jgi:hypothetical protein
VGQIQDTPLYACSYVQPLKPKQGTYKLNLNLIMSKKAYPRKRHVMSELTDLYHQFNEELAAGKLHELEQYTSGKYYQVIPR